MADVFSFLDYRAFLRAHYDERKARRRGFSFRAFSRLAGLRSPNYLKLVMDGARNLTPAMAERFAKACGLTGEAARYFVDLVAFGQAKTALERNAAFERLASSRRSRKALRLELAHAAYHSTWYLPAIRELAARPDFRAKSEWIAPRLRPPVARADVDKALEILFDLGLLVRGKRGKVTQSEAIVTTGAETRGMHIANYHRMMLDRAKESLDTVPAAERDVSALTLCVGPEGLHAIKERIRRFRAELLELSALEQSPTEVVQINFQLFPLTRTDPEEPRT